MCVTIIYYVPVSLFDPNVSHCPVLISNKLILKILRYIKAWVAN